jgi:O-antigen/teichoic acid export membrane protein
LLVVSSIAVGVYKWGDLYTELYAGELQLTRDTRKLLVVGLASGLTVALGALLVAVLQLPFHVLLLVIAVSGVLSAVFFAFAIGPRKPKNQSSVLAAIKLGFPLGLSSAIGTFLTTTPQYLVFALFGPERLGTLAVILYLFALADLLGGAYGQAWVHRIKALPQTHLQLKYAVKIGTQSSLAFLPIAALGGYVFALIAPLVFSNNVTFGFFELIPLTAAIAILPFAHMISIAILVQNAYRQSLVIAILSAVSVASAAAILIPPFGVSGALWAVAAGVFTRAVSPILMNLSSLNDGESK